MPVTSKLFSRTWPAVTPGKFCSTHNAVSDVNSVEGKGSPPQRRSSPRTTTRGAWRSVDVPVVSVEVSRARVTSTSEIVTVRVVDELEGRRPAESCAAADTTSVATRVSESIRARRARFGRMTRGEVNTHVV